MSRTARALAGMALLAVAALEGPSTAQTGAAPPGARGLLNWVHTTGDAERAFPFYHDVLGLELARSPFAPPGAAPEGIRPAAEAGSDELVWNLTNTRGSRFRTVFMRAANTPFGLELSEFFDIARSERPANAWDPGASLLVFDVRDLDATAAKLKARGAPVVTLGGVPVDTPAGRSLLVRDPDGYLIRVTQASPAQIAAAESPGDVIGTSIGISVADSDTALKFYRDLLGFEVREQRRADAAERKVYGIDEGELTFTTTVIPTTGIVVLLAQFDVPAAVTPAPHPYEWKIQDVGAPQFQLEVSGLDALLALTHAAGYRFLSVGAEPIERAFGRFVFAIDADGVLVEFVEPAAARAGARRD
jgi:predicted enzyme related to lactoylglutathione lyase